MSCWVVPALVVPWWVVPALDVPALDVPALAGTAVAALGLAGLGAAETGVGPACRAPVRRVQAVAAIHDDAPARPTRDLGRVELTELVPLSHDNDGVRT